MSILSLLVVLIVCGLIYWGTNALIAAFGIGDPIATVIKVLVVLVLVLYVVQFFGLMPRGLRLS